MYAFCGDDLHNCDHNDLPLHRLWAHATLQYLLQSHHDLLCWSEMCIHPLQYDTQHFHHPLSYVYLDIFCEHDGGGSYRRFAFIQKITDKLKSKIVDLIILAYIIDLKFNF